MLRNEKERMKRIEAYDKRNLEKRYREIDGYN